MGDPKKAAAWEWAAHCLELSAYECLRNDAEVETVNHALTVVVPYLRKMATRIETRRTRADRLRETPADK